jgi:hypothetical protein
MVNALQSTNLSGLNHQNSPYPIWMYIAATKSFDSCRPALFKVVESNRFVKELQPSVDILLNAFVNAEGIEQVLSVVKCLNCISGLTFVMSSKVFNLLSLEVIYAQKVLKNRSDNHA